MPKVTTARKWEEGFNPGLLAPRVPGLFPPSSPTKFPKCPSNPSAAAAPHPRLPPGWMQQPPTPSSLALRNTEQIIMKRQKEKPSREEAKHPCPEAALCSHHRSHMEKKQHEQLLPQRGIPEQSTEWKEASCRSDAICTITPTTKAVTQILQEWVCVCVCV